MTFWQMCFRKVGLQEFRTLNMKQGRTNTNLYCESNVTDTTMVIEKMCRDPRNERRLAAGL
jgi:hypothetical protein